MLYLDAYKIDVFRIAKRLNLERRGYNKMKFHGNITI